MYKTGISIKKIFEQKAMSDREREIPKIRWEEQVVKDIRGTDAEGWRENVGNRMGWRTVNAYIGVHSSLYVLKLEV